MSRNTATYNFTGNFDVKKAAPLDNRILVSSKEDLTKAETWQSDGQEYTYVGMIVACEDAIGKLYQLKAKDYTKSENWILISDDFVQVDWNESDSTSKAYIQNKPTIPTDEVQIITDGSENIDSGVKIVIETDTEAYTNLLTKDQIIDRINTTVATETSRAKAAEAANAANIANEITRAKAAEANAITSVKSNILGDASANYNTLGKLEDQIQEVDSKISALNTSAISRTATSATDTKVAVSGTTTEAAIESLATSIKTVKDNAAKYTITKITTNLASNIKEAYQLVETGTSTNVGVQIPIYKDSSLKSVELVDSNGTTSGQFLKFVYILTDGSENIQYLDVSKFLIESEFKNGLQVNTSGEVSVLIDPDSKFLSVSGKGLKVSDVQNTPTITELVTTTDTIPVVGGPLASLLNNAGINEISAGQDLQKLLLSLFTKELWGSAKFTEGTLSASISQPSFTVNNSSNSSQIVEFGSTVTVSSVTAPATSYSSSNRSITGLTYGYSTDKSTINTSTSYNVSINSVAKSGTASLTRTGLGTTETGTSLASNTFIATEGNTIIKVAVTGQIVSGNFAAIPALWICSNLKNMDDTHKTSAYAITTKTTSAPTNSKSITVTGVYPFYASTGSTISSTLTKQTLTTNKTFEITMPAETASIKHAFSTNKTVSSVYRWDSVTQSYVSYDINTYFTKSTETRTLGSTSVTYNRYTRNDGTNGSTKFKITIA